MMMKVFPYGTGGGFGPVEYDVSPNPFGRGLRNTAPRILKGDPAMMRRQIDVVPFQWKYSSGALSFAKEDDPTDDQIAELMEEFEELAFAGLPMSSRSIFCVLHEEDGRKDLHFILPRQEVHSGKSFNAFPPGWEKKFDHMRDKFNFKYGWARPDDPLRARAWQPGVNALIQADAKRKGKDVPPADGAKITDHLANMALDGKLQNRADIVRELTSLGYELPRQGKEYLTALEPKSGKRTRLKGTLYHESFHGPTWIKEQIAAVKRERNPVKTPDSVKAAEADAALRKAIEKTAAYNQNRYRLKENDHDGRNIETITDGYRTAGIHSRETLPAEERKTHPGNGISAPGAGISRDIHVPVCRRCILLRWPRFPGRRNEFQPKPLPFMTAKLCRPFMGQSGGTRRWSIFTA